MIVEDDEDVMAYIKNELSPYFLLELAGNGQEALERIQQKGEDNIDLIVSDIRMPRMDGLTLLKKVRADDNLFDIPFILLTAISSIEKQVQGLRFGADDYLATFTMRKTVTSSSLPILSPTGLTAGATVLSARTARSAIRWR